MADPYELAEWYLEAECRGRPSEWWVPPTRPDGSPNLDHEAQRRAIAICHECRVRVECLEDSLNPWQPEGVWGGLTKSERARERAARRRGEVTLPIPSHTQGTLL